MTDLLRIIYSSQPFGYDAAMLSGILLDARRCNRRDAVTGALVCRADIYLQLLEGPAEAVRATLARIRRDDRHTGLSLHVSRPVSERLFANWAMHHDPAQTWFWDQSEIAGGALERARPEAFDALFARLAATLEASAPD